MSLSFHGDGAIPVRTDAIRRRVDSARKAGQTMNAALAVTVVLVFLMGVAIQRGNTCTVVAFDDLVHRRSWHRLESIVFIWFLIAGGLTLMEWATGHNPVPALVPVAAWSVVGGLILGLGALKDGPGPELALIDGAQGPN
jgi:hypothetical protein